MKKWLAILLIIIVSLAQISCFDADVSGLVSSSDVDTRFVWYLRILNFSQPEVLSFNNTLISKKSII